MRTRIALAAVVACLTAGLLPTTAGASPLCLKHQQGKLNIQLGYCP